MVLRGIWLSPSLILSASFLLSFVYPQGWLVTEEKTCTGSDTPGMWLRKSWRYFPPEANQVGDPGCFLQWTKLKDPSQELLKTQAASFPGPSLPTNTHSQLSKLPLQLLHASPWLHGPVQSWSHPQAVTPQVDSRLVKNLVAKWTSVQILSSSPGLWEACLSQMISALSVPHILW